MDLSRTFDQLKTLFADNVTGNITEQIMRDLVESMFQYGGVSLPASQFAGQSQTIGLNFVCLDQFAFSNISTSDVVVLADGIKFLRPGVYRVSVGLSFTGTNNAIFEGNLVRKRASEPDEPLDICTFLETIRPNNEVSNAGGSDPLLVEANDIIEYHLKADSAGRNFELRSGQLNVFRIG